MKFNEYQKKAKETCKKESYNMDYLVVGLCSEAGEVAGKWKKIIRDFGGQMTFEKRDEISKELGDVLWYIALLSDILGYDLSLIAFKNLKKLADRKRRNKISGSGDDR